jgi:hypothetical protein
MLMPFFCFMLHLQCAKIATSSKEAATTVQAFAWVYVTWFKRWEGRTGEAPKLGETLFLLKAEQMPGGALSHIMFMNRVAGLLTETGIHFIFY